MYISTESKNILINMDENLNFKCMLKYNLELVWERPKKIMIG